MRIEAETKLDFDDVLIRPKRSTLASRSNVDLYRTYTFLNSKQIYTGIPLIASNMNTVGTIGAALALQQYHILTCFHKFINYDEVKEYENKASKSELWFDWFAITLGEDFKIENQSYLPVVKYLLLDAANGYREEFVDAVKRIKGAFSHHSPVIIAGNVVTPEMTEQLLLAGADIVKVGIGSGGQCTTRLKTGVGYPQLSAIIECADAAHGLKGHIAADGGCRVPGDICKAFAAGADFVMLGSMLAAHNENTAKKDIERDLHGFYTHTYGMSSTTAQEKFYGGVAKHRSSEGKTTKLYMRGSINETIDDILGALRSCCTYVGAQSLKELSKRTTFILVNQQRNTFYDEQQVSD